MKKIIPIAVLLLLTYSIKAQENAILFQIENESILLLEAYQPAGIIECYSTIGGGKQINKIKLNEEGKGWQIFDASHTPAFILNRKSPENINGNNRVVHLAEKEFITKNITFDIIAQHVSLSWDALIPAGNHIEFQISKKEPGEDYKIMKIISGNNDEGFNHYHFSESYAPNTTYIMQIIKDGNKLRYATGPLAHAAASEWVRVYPTVCNENMFIDMLSMSNKPEYIVTDMSGKQIMKASLNDLYNKIDVSRLSPGIYLVSITNGHEQKNFKITKN